LLFPIYTIRTAILAANPSNRNNKLDPFILRLPVELAEAHEKRFGN
jgi:hypothetical protein